MKDAYKMVLVLAILLAGITFISVRHDAMGASAGGAYAPFQVTSANASTTAGVVIRGGWGELGHIVINSGTTTAPITIYDGATSATSGLTVIGVLNASASNGTYTYEAVVNNGVVLQVPTAFNGNLTVMTR